MAPSVNGGRGERPEAFPVSCALEDAARDAEMGKGAVQGREREAVHGVASGDSVICVKLA